MQSLSRRVEIRPWASHLTAFVFITTLTVSACVPEGACPRSLDCAREGRHFCQPGFTRCGPCLAPLVERKGRCVVRRQQNPHHHLSKANGRPELDEEIDFLSSFITKQLKSEPRHSVPSSQVDLKAQEDVSVPQKAHQTAEASPSPSPTLDTTEHPITSGLTTAMPITTTATTTTTTPASHLPHTPAMQRGSLADPASSNDHTFIIMTGVCLMVAAVFLVVAASLWVRLRRGMRLAQKADYPAFGVMAPHSHDSTSSGDKKLAHSAQMYHYQHQKQQMLSLKHRDEAKMPESGATSDEENEDGDFTVYECPGLAPTGEMEVKNPLFDDSTLHLHLNLQKGYQ
ncbi:neural proliferation differentiation and control protein 1 [Sardina pilchardus]|uniref:neural proliferation differentiation and control protein 1 n=1 Tax=Sardina pilchardus TaxID=27697 RepID=UPI002E13B7E1